MPRFPILVLLAALCLGAGTAQSAPAPAPDLFTVSSVKVDATAESATTARDLAMTQGRPAAWTKLFRRLTATANWNKQPALDDNGLLRLIRSFEVAGERRSTTRYLAEVTFHFNPAAVRALLRQSNIAYTETRSRPILVIPLVAGTEFDPASPWGMAWKDLSAEPGLVPFLVAAADVPEAALLSRPDAAQADWAAVAPLARRFNAGEVIVATASEDAKSVQMVQVSATGRTALSFAYAQSSFAADAEAVAERATETWKTRTAVSYATRARLTADVQFDSLEDWAKIRGQIAAVRAISDVDVVGLALHEAEIDLTYAGRPEQLRDALAQQSLELVNTSGQYILQLAGRSAANSP
jgi:hypothetical protein